MSYFNRKLQKRRKKFKKRSSKESTIRKRHEITINISRMKREANLLKRRNPRNTTEIEITNEEILKHISRLDLYLDWLQGNDQEKQYQSLQYLRVLLSLEENVPIREIISGGFIPLLASFLQKDNPSFKFEATWCLSNIAADTHENTHAVVKSGVVTNFIRLLLSEIEELRNQYLKISLLKIFKNQNYYFHKKKAVLKSAIFTQYCAPVIHCYISDGPLVNIKAIVSAKIPQSIVKCIMREPFSIKIAALRVIGNIVSGNEQNSNSLLKEGLLTILDNLIYCGSSLIRKEICWIISNICGGSIKNNAMVIDQGFDKLMIEILNQGSFGSQIEAAWAISNMVIKSDLKHLQKLITLNVIKSLCDSLYLNETLVAINVLEALEKILRIGNYFAEMENQNYNKYIHIIEEFGGYDIIEKLCNNENKILVERAVYITNNYFDSILDDEIPFNSLDQSTSQERVKNQEQFYEEMTYNF
ncbi:importin subunit alpha-4 [Anaeramoeba flamelloides]|uniref:Importin subunit alpha n=1 Tax=Anaeramoeba flamelloides TaxID=1746091 RepID=A0ABQ8XRA7_9EUKA|nr:importin subunit alpha-4 [Anaeramoeba flamelloides]